jgi:hypothetical protein
MELIANNKSKKNVKVALSFGTQINKYEKMEINFNACMD